MSSSNSVKTSDGNAKDQSLDKTDGSDEHQSTSNTTGEASQQTTSSDKEEAKDGDDGEKDVKNNDCTSQKTGSDNDCKDGGGSSAD